MHLEMRDSYMRDDPEFIRWQEGYRYDPADRDSWWRSWLDVVAETTGRGVVMRRLRVVSEPLSDYVRYEYDGTFSNVAAGEDVRWLPRSRARGRLHAQRMHGWRIRLRRPAKPGVTPVGEPRRQAPTRYLYHVPSRGGRGERRSAQG